MNKIIDLDLDFFQNDVIRDFCGIQDSKKGLKPWPVRDVREYLENNITLLLQSQEEFLKHMTALFIFGVNWSSNID